MGYGFNHRIAQTFLVDVNQLPSAFPDTPSD
jgi:hypothetical protein